MGERTKGEPEWKRFTRLQTELLYTLWLAKTGGNADGLTSEQVVEKTTPRWPCTLGSVRKALQGLQNRHLPEPPVESWRWDDESTVASEPAGRPRNLWSIDRRYLVTLPQTAFLLKIAHAWEHSCINASKFAFELKHFGFTDAMFHESVGFAVESQYLRERETYELFYVLEMRTTAEIDYILKIAAHFFALHSSDVPPDKGNA